MRSHRFTGVVASAALVAALAGGGFAAASASADAPHHLTPRATPAAPSAPVDAGALLAQAKTLGNVGGVTAAVTKLVQDALASPVSTDKVTADAAAAQSAIDTAKQALPAPVTPAVPGTPAKPAAPAAPTAHAAHRGQPRSAADVQSDALAALQTAVNDLTKAVTAGDLAGTVAAGTAVITALVNVAVAAVLGGGLPAPNLPGLPTLPSLPSVPTLPVPSA
jgi:hypothetical protein